MTEDIGCYFEARKLTNYCLEKDTLHVWTAQYIAKLSVFPYWVMQYEGVNLIPAPFELHVGFL